MTRSSEMPGSVGPEVDRVSRHEIAARAVVSATATAHSARRECGVPNDITAIAGFPRG